MRARAHRALGRLRAAADRPDAIASLEAALAAFRRLGMPYEAGKTRLLIATSLADRERETAIAEARAATKHHAAAGALASGARSPPPGVDVRCEPAIRLAPAGGDR
ncbi:hypothetical protein [Thermoactinospora rubra]|uniref:hypothetical protein n=1 Tax=Thermoactinospora rubra TaxID=1088767 RepID=UPI000A0FF857|nr:hypothetical protein [Thermoactinospora rubra]